MSFEMMSPSSDDEFGRHSMQSKNLISSANGVVTNIGECGFKCVRTTFLIFNLFFSFVGLTILLMGVWLHAERDEATNYYAQASKNINFINGPNFLLTIGGITLLVSLLACCGAKTGNYCMLGSYSAIILVILALQVTSIFITYVYRDRIESSLRRDFQKTLTEYGQHGFQDLTKSIDDLQKDFHCCGNEDYTDWFRTEWSPNATNSVPLSCCRFPRTQGCNKNLEENNDRVYMIGCYNHVKKYLLENLHIISGFGVWVVVVESLGILFSVILIVKLRKERAMNAAADDFHVKSEEYFKAD